MTNETKPSYKAISKEQIDALMKKYGANEHKEFFGAEVSDDLLNLYDNAPSVGGDAVAYLKEWKFEDDSRKRIDFHKSCEGWMERLGVNITPLYTTQQPDRVAELEAKLKEYESDAKRWNKVSFAIEQAINNGACNYEIEDAYDQAMKG